MDSKEDIEAMAVATMLPETAMSDMCGEAAGEWHARPDPGFVHPASRSNISDSLSPQPANPLAGTHNVASVPSNQQATGPSTNPTTSVSLPSNQNLLVDY